MSKIVIDISLSGISGTPTVNQTSLEHKRVETDTNIEMRDLFPCLSGFVSGTNQRIKSGIKFVENNLLFFET